MNSIDQTASTIQTQWGSPLDAKEWDRRFPGVMDGIGLLGGPANVVLQLALLPVGYGVAESKVESGSILRRPLKRARTTFTYLSVAMQGTTEEKLAYRRAVNWAHAQVRSTEDSSVKYNALDPELQMWVAACLFYGFADSYAKFHGISDPKTLREFYALASPLGTTLQVRPGMWPADLDAFNAYWDRGLDKLHVDEKVRAFLMQIVDLTFLGPVVSKLLGPFPRFVTTGFLPQRVRDVMGLDWSEAQERKFRRFIGAVGHVNSLLPRVVRQFPFNVVMWDFRRRVRKDLPLI